MHIRITLILKQPWPRSMNPHLCGLDTGISSFKNSTRDSNCKQLGRSYNKEDYLAPRSKFSHLKVFSLALQMPSIYVEEITRGQFRNQQLISSSYLPTLGFLVLPCHLRGFLRPSVFKMKLRLEEPPKPPKICSVLHT